MPPPSLGEFGAGQMDRFICAGICSRHFRPVLCVCHTNTHAGKFVRTEQVFNCGCKKYDRHKNNEDQNTSDHGNLQIIIFTLYDTGWEKKTPPS